MSTKVTIECGSERGVAVFPQSHGVVMGLPALVINGETYTCDVHALQDILIAERRDREGPVTGSPLLPFFAFADLPQHLQNVARPFAGLAQQMVGIMPPNAERDAGLRKLLEARDCCLRALIYQEVEGETA